MIPLRNGLDSLKPYTIDETTWNIKLDANERATNLPAGVQAELQRRLAGTSFNRYPDIAQLSLRQQIATSLGLKAVNIAIGNGSSQLLATLCYIFGGQGRKVVFPAPSFSMYPIYCQLADCQPQPVAMTEDFTVQPEQILAAALKEQASLIILCNPNNPTGGIMPLAAIEAVIAGASCPVVVDEAYYEFHGESALGLLTKYPNMVVVRTFSKAYGLASARVGYAIASELIISALYKVLLPYNINTLSLTAAEVVFEMRDQFKAAVNETKAERGRLTEALRELPGVTVYPSGTNFLLFKTNQAASLYKRLAAQGIGIKDFRTPTLNDCLRVTVGTPAENDAFLAVVKSGGR